MQFLVGLHAGPVGLVGANRMLSCHRQTRQVVLQQVVRRAVAHGLDCAVFANLARNQDEGQRRGPGQLPLAQQLQSLQAGEAWQVVVGDDQVPRLGQGGNKFRAGLDAPLQHLQGAPTQLRHDQRVVQLRVFQVQQADGARGDRVGASHGCQYRKAAWCPRRPPGSGRAKWDVFGPNFPSMFQHPLPKMLLKPILLVLGAVGTTPAL